MTSRATSGLRVYLTNTLEEVFDHKVELGMELVRWLIEESKQANAVKRDLPIMVILGNPPYSGHSANVSSRPVYNPKTKKYKDEITWIGKLIKDYYYVDGKPLGERNSKWLQDDYVKFIRFSQWKIEQTGFGVLAFITNHGYLDNPTFRGMRQSLLKTFDDIYILDLHGNSKKKEKAPDGSKDENVFDIQQGVAIGIFVKQKVASKKDAVVHHTHLYGLRDDKYEILLEKDISSTDWAESNPNSPYYLFAAQDQDLRSEYDDFISIKSIMKVNVLGFQTHRDDFSIAFDKREIEKRFTDFRSPDIDDNQIKRKFTLKDNRDWKIVFARKKIAKEENWKKFITKCVYRPFDERWCYFSEIAMDYPRRELIDHVFQKNNLCLLLPRQIGILGWRHISTSRYVAESCVVSTKTKEQNYNFPLYLYSENSTKDLFSGHADSSHTSRKPNLSPEFIAEVEKKLSMKFIPEGKGDLKKTIGPEDIFYYMYGVFHSPEYRKRYAEFLKIDFPRLPLTGDIKLFRQLAKLGEELAGLHLMEKTGKPLQPTRRKAPTLSNT